MSWVQRSAGGVSHGQRCHGHQAVHWTTAAAAEGLGASVTGTGFQLALLMLWPSHVTGTRSQAAPWAQVAMGSRAPTLGMAAGAQTADNGLWTTLRACERQLLTPGCRVPRCPAGSGAGPVVPGPEQMRAVVLTLQESDHGDRGVEAESCCAFMLLPLCKQQGSDADARAEETRATSVLLLQLCIAHSGSFCLCR